MKPFVMGEITPQPGGRHTRPSFSAGAFLIHDLDCTLGGAAGLGGGGSLGSLGTKVTKKSPRLLR
jgi:hypothetical protein